MRPAGARAPVLGSRGFGVNCGFDLPVTAPCHKPGNRSEIVVPPMSYDRSDAPAIEEARYGDSRLAFRAPMIDADAPHVAVIGSSEVLGRYVPRPMTDHLAEALRVPVANLGVQNASADAFAQDDAFLEQAAAAAVAVVQVMGAQNLSNRLYSVHPRRNDRFLRHSDGMRELYPEVDFSEFVFTRHMLETLRRVGESRFETVVAELREAWLARMRLLLGSLDAPTVLLTIEDGASGSVLGVDPLFVTPAMHAEVGALAQAVARCDVSGLADDAQLDEMRFDPSDRDLARAALPPVAHEAVAAALVPAVGPLLEGTALAPAPESGRESVA